MVRVSREIAIDAPPEEVWRHIEDPAKELKWRRPEVKDLETIGDGPVGEGTRYRGRTKIMGMTDDYVNEVVEFDPPNRIAWRYVESSGMMAANGHYMLIPTGDGGTRFEIVLEYHPTGFIGRLTEPIMPLLAGPILQRFAEQLKAESEAS
ncbi:MAG: SRPBCC family protein [Anaerolineales bacterium]